MDHLDYLQNYQNDLLCSQKTPLLIELNQDELKLLANDSNNNSVHYLPLLVAQQIYNQSLGEKGSHIIVLDGDHETPPDSFMLLEVLLEALRDELKSIKNITALKETLKTGISMATGGLLNDFAGEYLDNGFDFIFDEVSHHFSDLLSEVATHHIDISDTFLSEIEGVLGDTIGDQLGSLAGNINKQSLNLSSLAKSELDDLSGTFSKSNQVDVFQLTFKLLLAIGIDASKLLYINNPHKLDANSISMLSLLFSFAKNQKELDKHIGLSVVYTYSDKQFHLYTEVNQALQQKQQLLQAQRRFVQRYAMLEKPGSDIPMVAVKSSLFIGRHEELESLSRQFSYRQPTTLSVISGEPGIGKTTLVNQHLANIQKQEDIIKLTLFNEVGHSSTNTGLGSLEKSIIDEAKRLELLVSWKDKGVNFLKNIGTKENAFKVIGAIFSGSDKALSLADAGLQRVMLDKHVDGVKEAGTGDLDCKKDGGKQQQFDKLDKAIKKLQSICSKSLPIVLFVDDMQWIDDTASEYILTRLLQQPDLYIITTLRPSDATTILKEQLNRPSLYVNAIKLLNACGVRGAEPYQENVESYRLNAHITSLPGFDKHILSMLIHRVIKGTAEQSEALADAIFTILAGEGAEDVNTLFAVETLNMLCDKKLYSENNFERLILDSPLRFNPELLTIENTIKQTFVTLQAKYKNSLAHANDSGSGHQFNLMAYAVLEERLHLLKIYFGQTGNAAVNSLLFSSLLGTPFSSDLVKDVMLAITRTKQPELLPLKMHLIGSGTETHLLPEHYCIIDEVYEILRRMSVSGQRYQYRHGLLHTFLQKQFDYLLDSIFVSNPVKAKGCLFDLMYGNVRNTVSQIRDDLRIDSRFSTVQEFRFTYAALVNVLDKAFLFNPEAWSGEYIAALERLQKHYTDYNEIADAIQLAERTRYVCQYIPSDEREEYVIDNLMDLISLYKRTNRLDEVVVLYQEVLKTPESYESSGLGRNDLLSGLADAYSKLNRNEEAVVLCEQILAAQPPSSSARDIDILRSTAHCYAKLKRKDEAVVFAEEIVIRGGGVMDLVLLAYCYAQNLQLSDAIRVAEYALQCSKQGYKLTPDQAAQGHLESYAMLALCYQRANKVSQVIELEEEALPIIKGYYAKDPEVWGGYYSTCLSHLAKAYSQNGQFEPAHIYAEKSVALDEKFYAKTPGLWAKHYATSLLNLASVYKQNKSLRDAINLAEKALSLCREYHASGPAYWAELYVECLNVLADAYRGGDQEDAAVAMEEESQALCQHPTLEFAETIETSGVDNNSTNFASYFKSVKTDKDEIPYRERAVLLYQGFYASSMENESNQTKWDYDYFRALEKLAQCYKSNQQLGDAILLEEKSLPLYSPERIKRLRPSRVGSGESTTFIAYYAENFAEDYLQALSRLANSYAQNGQIEEGIKLQVTYLELAGECFAHDAQQWAMTYTDSINSLLHCYLKNNQYDNAVKLEQRALELYTSLCNTAPELWLNSFLACLYAIATACYKKNQLSHAVQVLQYGLDFCEAQYRKRPYIGRTNYIELLHALVGYSKKNQQMTEASLWNKTLLSIQDDGYAHTPDLSKYEAAINLMAKAEAMAEEVLELGERTVALYKIRFPDSYREGDALELGERAAALLRGYYSDSSGAWAFDYTQCLIKLATVYQQAGRLHDAVESQTLALTISESYFDIQSDIWSENYITSLTNLASYYQANQQLVEAIALEERALELLESLPYKKPSAWLKKQSESLIRIIDYYQNNNQVDKTMLLEEKALVIHESLYQHAPDRWAECYVRGASSLASHYRQCDLSQEAVLLEEKLLTVIEHYYEPKNRTTIGLFWAKKYIEMLTHLAAFRADNHQFDDAIQCEKTALAICKAYSWGYRYTPEWDEVYVKHLDAICCYYKQNGQMDEAVLVELDHLQIYSNVFLHTHDIDTDTHLARLDRLDDHCANDERLYWYQETVFKCMISTYKVFYQQCLDSDHPSLQKWREEYLYALNCYANFYSGIRDYYGVYEYFKGYFEVFSIDAIGRVEQSLEFIYPFIKYVHASTHLSPKESEHLDEAASDGSMANSEGSLEIFTMMVRDFNAQMTNKFADEYRNFLTLLLHGDENTSGYKALSLSSDPLDNEKYHLYKHYFLVPYHLYR